MSTMEGQPVYNNYMREQSLADCLGPAAFDEEKARIIADNPDWSESAVRRQVVKKMVLLLLMFKWKNQRQYAFALQPWSARRESKEQSFGNRPQGSLARRSVVLPIFERFDPEFDHMDHLENFEDWIEEEEATVEQIRAVHEDRRRREQTRRREAEVRVGHKAVGRSVRLLR